MDEEFHKQNKVLCRAIVAGDEDSKEKIIMHNSILIKNIFRKRFCWIKFSEREDYLQVGKLALLKAVKNYDENHTSGAQFSTYAYKYIYFHMLELCLKQRHDISLDTEPVGENMTLGEVIPSYENQFDIIIDDQQESPFFDAIKPFVARLPEIDRKIIKLKYIYSNKNYSDEEFAKFFHLSKADFLERAMKACSNLKELIENQNFIKKYLKPDK